MNRRKEHRGFDEDMRKSFVAIVVSWTASNPAFWLTVAPLIIACLDSVGYWGYPKPLYDAYFRPLLPETPFLNLFLFQIAGVSLAVVATLLLAVLKRSNKPVLEGLAIFWNRWLVYRIAVFTIAGASLCVVNDWIVLPVATLLWLLYESMAPKKHVTKAILASALATGLFLMVFDFIVENLGYVLGFWSSLHSHLFVLYVPLEVMLTCFLGGAAWALLISSIRKTWRFIILNSTIWAIGGCFSEWYFNLYALMQYSNGWTFIPHTFIGYFLTWLILHAFNITMQKHTGRT